MTGPTWRQRYERARVSRARLESLAAEESAAPTGELSETGAWERTCLEVELAVTRDDARAVAARFAARWPGHALGRFALGQMLLAIDDPEGREHVAEAMRLDSRLAGDGEEAAAAYLRRVGQPEAAAERLRNAVRHGDMLDAGRVERAQVTARDHFLPHGLDTAAVEAMRAQLARHPRVSKVWLARKEVARFPEQPWYVMVCVFKWNRWEAGSRKRLHAIFHELRTGLTVAGREDFYFQLLDVRHRNGALARKVRKTAVDAQVYPPPQLGRRAWWQWWGARAPAEPVAPVSRPVAAVGGGQALRLPPPLPVLPKSTAAFSRAPVPRRVSALALCAAVIVVAVPVGYVIHLALAPGGAWQHFRAGFVTGLHSGRSRDAMAEASRPIPRDPQASTEEDDRRLALAWAQRTMLGGFNSAGRRNVRWNTAAHTFIEHSLPWWAGLHDCTTTTADLLPQERALLHAGCDDPLVLCLAGLVEARADRQSPTATPLFNRAVTGFQNTPYARGVAWVAAAEAVADCEGRRDGTDQSKPAKQWWQYWFRSGVVFGHPDMDSDDWQSFRLKRNGPEGAIATVSCHWYDGPKQTLAVPDHNTFALQSWHGQLTLVINGKMVFNGQHLDRGQVNDRSGLVGLGGYSHQGNTFAVSYRHLQIRRLGADGGGRAGGQGSGALSKSMDPRCGPHAVAGGG